MKQFLAAALLTLASGNLLAQTGDVDWTGINLAVTDQQVVPAYARFAEAGSTLLPAAQALCAAPDTDTLAAMQSSFHAAMDAWQGIAHVQFGPVTYFNWNYRLQYWPDEKGTGARQLEALLAAADTSVLEPQAFERQSVGVQGFPALEQLLFADDALPALQAQPYRCQLVTAIAANLGSIATGLHARWQDEFRGVIASPEQSGQFESAQDATVDFYKALVESLRRYQQQKLEAVLGESQQQARERRAESWRSQRSLRNIELNLAALQALYGGSEPALGMALLAEDRDSIAAHFNTTLQYAAALPDDFAPLLATAGGYAQLQQLAQHCDALFEALEAALKRTDLYLGFNSLDGD